MKQRKLRNMIFLLLPIFIMAAIASCSEEIVPITIQDRTALDSLEQEIAVIGNDITDAQIARDSLERYQKELQKQLDDLLALTADSAFADVHYTVQVTDGSLAYNNSPLPRVASLSGALVSVSQGNAFQEVTTDGTGFATFPAMDNGFISVTVELAGFSDVYLVVDLGSSESGDSRNVSTQVMVFPTTGSTMFTVTGTSYYEQDVNNQRAGDIGNPLHPFQGANIYEIVPTGTSFIVDCTPTVIPNNIGGTPGFVVAAVYAGLQRVATSDASGNWTLTLPVVLLSTAGTNLFTYDGPKEGDQIKGTRINLTPAPNTEEIWKVDTLFPQTLSDIQIFPGGNSVQDLYYIEL